MQRESKFTPEMFLETLVFSKFNQKQLSLNEMSNTLDINYHLSISKQGVDERFNEHSVSFLKACVCNLLSNHFKENTNISAFSNFNSVRIKDSTAFTLPPHMCDIFPGTGGKLSAAGMRIQFEYDLKSGQVMDLDITPHNTNDFQDAADKNENIQKNDLIIRDLGYISVQLLKEISQKDAFFINRLKTQTNIYNASDRTRKQITLAQIEQKLIQSKNEFIEMDVFIGDRQYFPVRLIACRLPEEKIKERINRLRRRNQRAVRPFNEASCDTAGLNLFITNV